MGKAIKRNKVSKEKDDAIKEPVHVASAPSSFKDKCPGIQRQEEKKPRHRAALPKRKVPKKQRLQTPIPVMKKEVTCKMVSNTVSVKSFGTQNPAKKCSSCKKASTYKWGKKVGKKYASSKKPNAKKCADIYHKKVLKKCERPADQEEAVDCSTSHSLLSFFHEISEIDCGYKKICAPSITAFVSSFDFFGDIKAIDPSTASQKTPKHHGRKLAKRGPCRDEKCDKTTSKKKRTT